MSENYRVSVRPKPGWKKLIIVEAREGNFEELNFPSPLIRRYWVVDALGITQVTNPRFENGVCGMFYEMPSLRFFTDGDYLLVSERLGPNLFLRRLHRVSISDGKLLIGEPVKRRLFGRDSTET